ncbi:hypothetical protein AX17_003602 [Amanita inopinata Kibby_2008]|nr:hypothetical protein AX17_003602 [Amanita inopinata Kibby_2008]
MFMTSPEPNISLETHLVETLRPLQVLLPRELSDELSPYLSPSPAPVIPYSLLLSISRWTRSKTAADTLRAQCPPLNPQSYSMVSLLAGTTTSPDRFFGQYTPPDDPEEVQAEKNREKKAITALFNALLSIGGSAAAVWWAAERAGWRNEWRTLLAFFVAIVVAVSEGVLFIIWESRRTQALERKRKRKLLAIEHKKMESEPHSPEPEGVTSTAMATVHSSQLRLRK